MVRISSSLSAALVPTTKLMIMPDNSIYRFTRIIQNQWIWIANSKHVIFQITVSSYTQHIEIQWADEAARSFEFTFVEYDSAHIRQLAAAGAQKGNNIRT